MNSKSTKTCSSLKSEARGILEGKYLIFVMVCLSFLCSYILLNFFFSLIYAAFYRFFGASGNTVIMEVLNFLLSVCCVILASNLIPGICLLCLKAIHRRAGTTADLFFAYQNNVQRNLTVSAVLTIPRLLLLEPYSVYFNRFNTTWDTSFLPPAALCLTAGILLCIPIDMTAVIIYFLMLDFPQYSVKELFRTSFRLVKENGTKLLSMEFSFVPVILLCVMSLGIGLLWGIPYIAMTYACSYLDIMTPSEPSLN